MLDQALQEVNDGVKGVVTKMQRIDDRLDVLEERLRVRKFGITGGGGSSGVSEGASQFSLAKAVVGIGMKALGQDVWKEIKGEYEREVLIESTQKALDTGTGGAGGGYVVPIQTLPDFIERLYANLVVKQAGALVLPNLIGSPVYIPKQLTWQTSIGSAKKHQ